MKTPRLTALRCAPARHRLRIAEAADEQPREEVAAIVLITALIVATLVVAWRHRGGATTIAFAAIDRTFGNLRFLAPQDRDQHLVAAVHVFAEFQTAVIVDERRLVGQMHRQVVRELNVLLSPACDHLVNALLRVALARPHDAEQHLGVFRPDLARACSHG